MEVYIVDINELLPKEKYDEWLNKVSDELQERICRFHFKEDVKRTLYGEILVRYLACHKLHINNEDIVIGRNIYGKPYLKGYPVFSYNISHSGKWIICAIANYPIGVDIEFIEYIDLNVAKRFFTKSEYQMILMDANQDQMFYQIWTAKESYIKYIGKGLSLPLNSFNIHMKDSNSYIVDTDASCIIRIFYLLENYTVSICHNLMEGENIEFHKLEMADIIL